MGDHLVNGKFQSDKYPTTPAGKVPLSTADPMAQDLLHEYACRRRAVDAEFSDDLIAALRLDGFDPDGKRPPPAPEDVFSGVVELTAGQRAYVSHALTESYMNGGWMPDVANRREFHRRVVGSLLGPLKLTRMATPDGHLVSVAEHDAAVAGARGEEAQDGPAGGPSASSPTGSPRSPGA